MFIYTIWTANAAEEIKIKRGEKYEFYGIC